MTAHCTERRCHLRHRLCALLSPSFVRQSLARGQPHVRDVLIEREPYVRELAQIYTASNFKTVLPTSSRVI